MPRPYRTAPNYFRAGQVAELLQVSPATIHRWVKEGKLPCVRTLGGHRRYPEAEVRTLLAELTYRPGDTEVRRLQT